MNGYKEWEQIDESKFADDWDEQTRKIVMKVLTTANTDRTETARVVSYNSGTSEATIIFQGGTTEVPYIPNVSGVTLIEHDTVHVLYPKGKLKAYIVRKIGHITP